MNIHFKDELEICLLSEMEECKTKAEVEKMSEDIIELVGQCRQIIEDTLEH